MQQATSYAAESGCCWQVASCQLRTGSARASAPHTADHVHSQIIPAQWSHAPTTADGTPGASAAGKGCCRCRRTCMAARLAGAKVSLAARCTYHSEALHGWERRTPKGIHAPAFTHRCAAGSPRHAVRRQARRREKGTRPHVGVQQVAVVSAIHYDTQPLKSRGISISLLLPQSTCLSGCLTDWSGTRSMNPICQIWLSRS